jgi:hypothetical protein
MRLLLITTAAVLLTGGAALAGFQGYPSKAQMDKCLDAWDQPKGAKCLAGKAKCEQAGGAFSIREGVPPPSILALQGSDGGRWTWNYFQCTKPVKW